jgi:hypothetical protein
MNQLVPDRSRIDRSALERIVRRAAELQTGERDIGDGLTEHQLMELGHEVGIPTTYLQQALQEERTRAVVPIERGLVRQLTGPKRVAAQRTIAGMADGLQSALNHWMTDGELLTVKRRFPDRTSWEARQDVFSSIRREFKVGGRPYRLARAKEVVGQVTRLEEGRAHVRLLADLSNTRQSHLAAATTLAGVGAVASAIGLVLSVALPVALIPVGLGAVLGTMVARRRMGQVERVQVALEQVIDRLEHGEVRAPEGPRGPRSSAFGRIADEIKKSLGI